MHESTFTLSGSKMDEITASCSSPYLRLPNQKNIVKFFRSFDIAQVVCIKVNQSRFLVNSVLLVLHSPVFEDLIYSGAEEIILDHSLQFPGAEMMIYQCLLYLYGDTVTINLDQVLNIHHFASVYKIKSMREQCEKSFVGLLTGFDTYLGCLTEWFSNKKGHWYKSLIMRSSDKLIKFLTSSENLPAVLDIIQSESDMNDSLITKMLPCQDMFDIFYSKIIAKVTEPLDQIKLNLLKAKYCGSPVVLSKTRDCATGSKPSPTKDFISVSVETDTSAADKDILDSTAGLGGHVKLSPATMSSNVSKNVICWEKNTKSVDNNELLAKQSDAYDSHIKICPALSTMSCVANKKDLSLDLQMNKSTEVEDSPRVSFPTELRPLLLLSFADILKIAQTIRKGDVKNYLKIDLILTWVFHKKFQMNSNNFTKLCANLGHKSLSREYALDLEEVLSIAQKSTCVDFKDKHDNAFVIASKIIPQKLVLNYIRHNGSIFLTDTEDVCRLGSCKIVNHQLELFVLLKKSSKDVAAVLPIPFKAKGTIHSKHIIHFYLLALDKSLYVENIISLKVLTKDEILSACRQYPNFVLKIVFRQELSKPKSVGCNSSEVGCSSSQKGNLENVKTENRPESTTSGKNSPNVFITRLWKNFTFDDVVKFIRTGYDEVHYRNHQNVVKSKPGFVYLCIDLLFTWVIIGKSPLFAWFYKPIIASFDHTTISAEFINDVRTVFNSVSEKALFLNSKIGNKDSFLVSVSLDKSAIIHSIKNNGIIRPGIITNQCDLKNCPIDNHSFEMQIMLNKSVDSFSVKVTPVHKSHYSNIHSTKLLHFYILALDLNDRPIQLISLKLLSKLEVLDFVQQYQKFQLQVIYSKS